MNCILSGVRGMKVPFSQSFSTASKRPFADVSGAHGAVCKVRAIEGVCVEHFVWVYSEVQ